MKEGEEVKGEEEAEGRREDVEEKQKGESGKAVVEPASLVEAQTVALTVTTEELYVPALDEEANTEPTDTRDDAKPTLTDPPDPLSTDDAATLSITDETTVAAELHRESPPPAASQDPPRDDAHGSAGAMDVGLPATSEMSNESSGDSHNAVILPSSVLPDDPHSPPPLALPVTEVHHAEVSHTTPSSEATEPRQMSDEAANEHSESKDPVCEVAAGKSADTPDNTEDVQSQLLESRLGEGSSSGSHEEHQSELVRVIRPVLSSRII